jgi:serine/threonine protein kinase
VERAEGVEVAVGSQLGGYRLGAVFAEGTLGTIHAGIHPLFRKRVAIKVLKRCVVHDTRALTAFVKEVYAINEIGHPGVVDVYSIGALDDGRFFVVSDLVEGQSLRQLQQRKHRLQPGVALPIFEQLCRIIETVHEAGFLHLGLRPERVLVLGCPPHPTIRVLGFGSDHLTSNTSVDIREPTMMSTPAYAAPEQQPGGTVDDRADIYSVGALLYELVVGRRPSLYPEADRAEGLAAVGGTLRQVVLKALATKPDERFGSAAELLEALREALGAPLPWNVDLVQPSVEAQPSGETGVSGPPTTPSVDPPAPETDVSGPPATPSVDPPAPETDVSGLPATLSVDPPAPETDVSGPPATPSVDPFAPVEIDGEIPDDEISARAALTFRNVDDEVEYTESTETTEVPTASTAEVPKTPEAAPLAPGNVLGELNIDEIDEAEVGGLHVLTEVTPPRGDTAEVEAPDDAGEGLELDFSTDVVEHGAPPVGQVDLAPAAGEVDLAPAAGEVDLAPAAGEVDLAPAAGEVDLAPAAGEVDLAPAAGEQEISGFGFIVAGGSDDVEVVTDVQEAVQPLFSEEEGDYLADDVTHDVPPPVDEAPELDAKTGLYSPTDEKVEREATQNEVVVSGLIEHAPDEAYEEPDVTVPFKKAEPEPAEPAEPPPISLSNLAAHAHEEGDYVEPDLTRPYGPEVEEVLAQEKQADAPRPKYPAVGPLAPEPLEPAPDGEVPLARLKLKKRSEVPLPQTRPAGPPANVEDADIPQPDRERERSKTPDDAYLSLELLDDADKDG